MKKHPQVFVCAWCKKVLSTSKAGHGICLECLEKYFPEDGSMPSELPKRAKS